MKRLPATVVMTLMLVGAGHFVLGVNSSTADQSQLPKQAPKNKYLTNSIKMKLALIPAGKFIMGSPDSDKAASLDEKPRHLVKITRPFHMGVFEVTQEEYQKVMGSNPSFFSHTGPGKKRVKGMDTDRFPAEQIRWHDAVEFCRRLSELPAEKKAGRAYRLPTEAEWEYACRAGSTTAFHFGDALSSRQANFNGKSPFGGAPSGPFLTRTTKVGSYPANAFGLYDMHGNVWEWCSDWYGRTYYQDSPKEDPPGPKTGSMRVIRGGGWYADGNDCRSAFRYADIPGGIFYVMGFRVVMVPADQVDLTITQEPDVPKKPTTKKLASPKNHPALGLPGEDWPKWRGPRGDGTWHGPKLPGKWPARGLATIWRQPVGGGHSAVVVSSGRVFVTDYQEEPKPTERVLCFDAVTGRQLWSYGYQVDYERLAYGNGPRAAPLVHEGRVYTLGAVGRLQCLDAKTGKPYWSKHLVKDFGAKAPRWGFSGAPIISEDLLIIQAGAKPNGGVLALDRLTGKEVWRRLPDESGYATPIIINRLGQAQLVCWTPTNVRGLDLHSGKLFWTIPFEVAYGTSIATPIFHDNIVLVSGYYEGTKAIVPGTAQMRAKLLWEDRRNLRALMSQPLCRKGYVYLLDRRNGLTCFELKTGKKLWDDGNQMTPKGRNPQATMVWAGREDLALILNSEGDLILARLNPAGYQELSRTNIIGPTWAHPAYAGNCVYARNDRELVCVVLSEAAARQE